MAPVWLNATEEKFCTKSEGMQIFLENKSEDYTEMMLSTLKPNTYHYLESRRYPILKIAYTKIAVINHLHIMPPQIKWPAHNRQ